MTVRSLRDRLDQVSVIFLFFLFVPVRNGDEICACVIQTPIFLFLLFRCVLDLHQASGSVAQT